MPLLSWPAADLLVCWLCHWTVADSALAYATRAMTLHPVAAHCACCCDRLCLNSLSRLWVAAIPRQFLKAKKPIIADPGEGCPLQ